jgi:hypothetical protein
MLFMKRQKPKTFDYIPRYYNPDKDPEEIRKRKLGFRSANSSKRISQKKSPIIYIVLFVMILYLFYKYSSMLN